MILKRHFAMRPNKYVKQVPEIEFIIIEKTILIGHVWVDIGKITPIFSSLAVSCPHKMVETVAGWPEHEGQ